MTIHACLHMSARHQTATVTNHLWVQKTVTFRMFQITNSEAIGGVSKFVGVKSSISVSPDCQDLGE